MRKIAVFGSLKKGFFNHDRFDLGEMLDKSTIRGSMFLFWSYPHLFRPGVCDESLEREHEVEIYEIEDGIYSRIESMEKGAGYQVYETEITGESGTNHNVVIFYSQDDLDWKDEKNWLESYTLEAINNR